MLVNRPRVDGREIYGDLSGGMVELLTELRDRPRLLIWRLRGTLYHRRIFDEARERMAARDAYTRQSQALWSRPTGDGWAAAKDVEAFSGRGRSYPPAVREGVADEAYTEHTQSAFAKGELSRSWGMSDGRLAKANANREGLDHYTERAQKLLGKDARGVWGSGTDSGRPPITANREGVDVNTLSSQSNIGAGMQPGRVDWGRGVAPIRNRARNQANREGVDIAVVSGQTVSGKDGGRSSWGHASDPRENRAQVESNRAGVDQQVGIGQGLNGGKGGWRSVKSGYRQESPESSFVNPAGTEASRAGVDSAVAQTQSVNAIGGAGASWSKSKTGAWSSDPDHPRGSHAVVEAARVGVDQTTVANQGLHGGGIHSTGWGRSRDGSEIGVISAETQARRIGVDPAIIAGQAIQAQMGNTWARSVIDGGHNPNTDAHRAGAAINGGFLAWRDTPLYKAAERLQGVEIYLADALDILAEWRDCPDAMIYLDPPYVPQARKTTGDYQHEMSVEQHVRMLELCQNAAAHIAISGYESELYAEMLAGWRNRVSGRHHQRGGWRQRRERREQAGGANRSPVDKLQHRSFGKPLRGGCSNEPRRARHVRAQGEIGLRHGRIWD